MQIVRAGEYRRMPWKNGGGETFEVAVFPPEASLNQFDWRISMARVASDGPFSIFPGIDRTLSILEGAGLWLEVDEADSIRLEPKSAPYRFSAERSASARLISGAILDLNVMTRIGRFDHLVEILTVDQGLEINCRDYACVIVANESSINHGDTKLDRNDAIILRNGEKIEIRAENNSAILLVKIAEL